MPGVAPRRGPGRGPGRQPTSRRPRPLVPAGISIRPEPSAASRPSSSARSRSASSAPAPRSPWPRRSPQTTTTFSASVSRRRRRAGPRRRPRRARRAARASARRGTRRARPGPERAVGALSARAVLRPTAPLGARCSLVEQRLLERAQQRLRRAGREAQHARPRRRRARSGALAATTSRAPERRTALRSRRSMIGASLIGSVSSTSTTEARSMSAHAPRARSGCESTRAAAGVERAAGARVDVRRAERLAEDPLEQVALLVGGRRRRRARPSPAPALRRPVGRRVERALPASPGAGGRRRARAAAVIRSVGVDRLVAPAPLVAQPAVVDVVVVARRARARRARRGR